MRLSAAIKALLAISFWGASFVATKIVLREVLPLAVVVLRFGIAIPVLAMVTAAALFGAFLVISRGQWSSGLGKIPATDRGEETHTLG
jgi:drug/metabolite transporter (DMT)-like permease